MHLHQLLDPALLDEMEREGYINVQPHPTEPLAIMNYSKKTAWEHKWNPVTRACRGLIYDYETMEIVSLPFPKFFNYEEHGPEWVPPTGPVQVTDKQDGSLGIIYPRSDGSYAVATRGSFTSDQALHATEVFNTRYKDDLLNLGAGVTYLVEIIYPANRIVLNYGDMDDLVLLGAVHNEWGKTYSPDEAAYLLDWPGPVAATLPAQSFTQALALPPRQNAEGVVVHFRDTDERVKLKQADYVALHRIVTGLTDRVIWEQLVKGVSVEEIKRPLPEEFHPWVDEVADGIYTRAGEIIESVWEDYTNLLRTLPPFWGRKEFALAVQDSPNRAYLFMYLDGRGIFDVVLKSLKPEAGRSMKTLEDDEE